MNAIPRPIKDEQFRAAYLIGIPLTLLPHDDQVTVAAVMLVGAALREKRVNIDEVMASRREGQCNSLTEIAVEVREMVRQRVGANIDGARVRN